MTEEEKPQEPTYSSYGAMIPESKENVHTFLSKVVVQKDTTKLGNLKDEEVGEPKHSIRTYKELALIAEKIIGDNELRDYYNAKSEIITATSLSRNAKLLDLAVVQRRELNVKDGQKKVNKGWFKKKTDENKEAQEQLT